jgi:hypothetical protein
MTKNLDAWIKAASCSVYPGIYITYLIQIHSTYIRAKCLLCELTQSVKFSLP